MNDLVTKYGAKNVQDYDSYSKAVSALITEGWDTFYKTFCYNEAMFIGCIKSNQIEDSAIEKFNFMDLFKISFEAAVGYVTDYYKANYLCPDTQPDMGQAFNCVMNMSSTNDACYMSEYNCWTLTKYQDCMSTEVYGQNCGASGRRFSCNIQNIQTTVRYTDCAVFLSDCS